MDANSDSDLLATWHSGNQEAFAVLVARHHGMVRVSCARQAAPGDIDDCVQAVFLVLTRRSSVAARSPSLAAWLLRVASFVCRHSRRAAERRQRAEHAAAKAIVASAGARPSDALSHLDECLLRLPERQRMAVVMHFLVGKEPEEVAASLNTSCDNTRQLISRGLATLRTLLARRGISMGSVALATLLTGEAQASAVPATTAIITTLTAVTPSSAASTLASGALTSMTFAAITPGLAVAGLLLSIGVLSVAITGEPEPATVVQVAARTEWTTQRFSDVVAAVGPGGDYSIRALLVRIGGSTVELPPGLVDRRRDLALAAWQLGYQSVFRPEGTPGRSAFMIEPMVGGATHTRMYDVGHLCQDGDGSKRREALRTLAAVRGQAAHFANTLVVNCGAVQHAYLERLLTGLQAQPHPRDGEILFHDDVSVTNRPIDKSLHAALEQRYPDRDGQAVTLRQILVGLRRHGIPILVQPGLAHLDEALRPVPTPEERISDVLERAGEALSVHYAIEGQLVLFGLTVPSEQSWQARWFQRQVGTPEGTLSEFTACLQMMVVPAGAAVPWDDGVLVLSPEVSMQTCDEFVRALKASRPIPTASPAPGF